MKTTLLPAALIDFTTLNVTSVCPVRLYETTSPTLKFFTQPVVPLVTIDSLPDFPATLNVLPVKSFLVSKTKSAANVLLPAVDLTDFTSLILYSTTAVITLPSNLPLILICSSFMN